MTFQQECFVMREDAKFPKLLLFAKKLESNNGKFLSRARNATAARQIDWLIFTKQSCKPAPTNVWSLYRWSRAHIGLVENIIYKEIMEYKSAHSTQTYAPNIRQVNTIFSLNHQLAKLLISFHTYKWVVNETEAEESATSSPLLFPLLCSIHTNKRKLIH